MSLNGWNLDMDNITGKMEPSETKTYNVRSHAKLSQTQFSFDQKQVDKSSRKSHFVQNTNSSSVNQ